MLAAQRAESMCEECVETRYRRSAACVGVSVCLSFVSLTSDEEMSEWSDVLCSLAWRQKRAERSLGRRDRYHLLVGRGIIHSHRKAATNVV